MKKFIYLFLMLCTFSFSAQSVNYKIVEDNPDAIADSYINLELFGGDFDFDFNDASIFAGANGYYSLSEKLKIEATLRLNYINLSGGGFGSQSEAGVLFILKSSTKTDKVPIIYSHNNDYFSKELVKNIKVTKVFEVDGTYKNQFGVRGGLYYKNSSFDAAASGTTSSQIADFSITGIYAGFEKISQAFVKTLVGKNFKYGQGRTRMYADAMFFPVKTINSNVVNAGDESSFGYRAGFQWQTKPVEGGWFKPVYTAEIGNRPFTGFYILVSAGITLMNF